MPWRGCFGALAWQATGGPRPRGLARHGRRIMSLLDDRAQLRGDACDTAAVDRFFAVFDEVHLISTF